MMQSISSGECQSLALDKLGRFLLNTIRVTVRRIFRRIQAGFNRIPLLKHRAAQKHLRLIEDLSRSFSANNLTCYVAGGYALDAMRGKLTRWHRDVDITVLDRDADAALSILKNNGFTICVKAPYVWGANRKDVSVDVFTWKSLDHGMVEHVAQCVQSEDHGVRLRSAFGVRMPVKFLTSTRSVELLGVRFMVPCTEYIASVYSAYRGEPDDWEFLNALRKTVRLELRQSTEVLHGVKTTIYESKCTS
jgi:hypothetical protein